VTAFNSIIPHSYEVIYQKNSTRQTDITVIVTCYNYGREGVDALNSLLAQTEDFFNLVFIDDHSPDNSVDLLLSWFVNNGATDKINSIKFIRHTENQGLSKSRNTAISLVNTPFVFILDADNQIYPRALTRLKCAIVNSGLEMAYSLIEVFGSESKIIGNSIWDTGKFAYGNYIDAMALLKTSVFHQLGGYRVMPNKFGWEDFDFWCKMVDHGLSGCHVPEVLCRYRVHDQSMLRTVTNDFVVKRLEALRADFEAHHSFKFYF
jgi:glycosyltransferase involved in cell wall biosynthesis